MRSSDRSNRCGGLRFRAFGVAASALLATALVACAGIPYIADTAPTPVCAMTTCTALQLSLSKASQIKAQYRDKLIEDADQRRKLAAWLIGIGAVTANLAINDNSTEAILQAALGGGVLYQLGTWNRSQDRLGIYVEGMKAMDCIATVAAPLNRDVDYMQKLDDAAATLRKAHADTALAMGNLVAALSAAEGVPPDLAVAGRSEIVNADAALTDSLKTLESAVETTSKITGVAAQVDARVALITTTIDDALRGTIASLESLKGHIQALSGFVQIFAPGTDINAITQAALAPRRDDDVNTQSEEIQERRAGEQRSVAIALGKLVEARENLLVAIRTVTALSTQLTHSADNVDLLSCGVDSARLSKPLQLEPATVRFTAAQADTKLVRITGGTTPYVAQLDSPGRGIDADVMVGTNVIRIVATSEVAASTFTVFIGDAASPQHTATLTVVVDAAVVENRASQPAGPDCSIVGSLDWTRNQVCLIQKLVGATVDGNFGDRTCASVAARWSDFNIAEPLTRMTREQATALRDSAYERMKLPANASDADIAGVNGDCDPAKQLIMPPATASTPVPTTGCTNQGRNALECAMTDDINGARRRLNQKLPLEGERAISETAGVFDGPMRSAISQFQQRSGLIGRPGVVEGQLDATTMAELERI